MTLKGAAPNTFCPHISGNIFQPECTVFYTYCTIGHVALNTGNVENSGSIGTNVS
jgi:hypothetical protein